MRIDGRVKGILAFASGAIISGFTTWFLVKKYYRKKCEEEIASVERAFTERINELEAEKDGVLDAAGKAIVASNEYNREDPGSRSVIQNKSTLDGMIKASKAERIDYTAYSRSDRNDVSGVLASEPAKNSVESIEVDDHPHDDGEEEDEAYENGIVEVGNGRDNIKEPYEIDYDEYGTNPGFEQKELYFYKGDGVVVESDGEGEEIVDNPEYLIGNVIDTSGFRTDEERNLYVRNEYISCDFEIIKVPGTYD